MSGFTARPNLQALAGLAHERGVPIYEDLGSGCVADLRSVGIDEPRVADSLRAGVDVVSFSGDKLLGGPQSGIIAGDEGLIQRIRQNPMYRAFRVDKLILQWLEETLRNLVCESWEAIPALRMIFTSLERLHDRARRIASRLDGWEFEICQSQSAIGGGSTPDQTLPSWTIQLRIEKLSAFEERLRLGKPPVICRVQRDRIVLDMRTVLDDEEPALVSALLAARG